MRSFDQIIVGQGIAGSTLAWHLRWRGQRVAVIDRDDCRTASKVAAGLVSPITGKRNAVSWRFDQFWKVAKYFYELVERETDEQFFTCQPMLKVLGRDTPLANGAQIYAGDYTQLPRPLDQLAAVELSPSGKLDVPTFLRATRIMFESEQAHFVGDVDPSRDLQSVGNELVSLKRFNVTAKKLIFCQGIAAQSNGLFPDITFQPTKGEILEVRIPGLFEQRVINHHGWLAPTIDQQFLCGATYDREYDDAEPTEDGRKRLLSKIAELGVKQIEVICHRAAERPTIRGRRPVVGFSPTRPQLGFFNGLGSSGTLRAPLVAKQLSEHLVHGHEVDPEFCHATANTKGRSQIRLTELAHQHVSEVLRAGDIAIDATAGNGFDTLFLSKAVGPEGQVFAFDIQQDAISRTRARLQTEAAGNVELRLASHEQLRTLLPGGCIGNVSVVMFNLGYLPRGDQQLVTKTRSTVAAIQQAVEVLRPGGLVSILAYVGHPGGMEEALAIEDLLTSLPATEFDLVHSRPFASTTSSIGDGPRFYAIKKQTKES